MATEDARYRQSSQYQLWSFSPSQLAGMREKTNFAAKSRIAERLSFVPAPSNNGLSAPASSANTPDPEGASTPALPEFLTAAEEALLVTFYTSELLRAGDHAKMSDEIKATAATFFRRFYVTNSLMTYPPQDMTIVSLFFGCKAEGSFITIGESVPYPSRWRGPGTHESLTSLYLQVRQDLWQGTPRRDPRRRVLIMSRPPVCSRCEASLPGTSRRRHGAWDAPRYRGKQHPVPQSWLPTYPLTLNSPTA